jgi:hypothetical protein
MYFNTRSVLIRRPRARLRWRLHSRWTRADGGAPVCYALAFPLIGVGTFAGNAASA